MIAALRREVESLLAYRDESLGFHRDASRRGPPGSGRDSSRNERGSFQAPPASGQFVGRVFGAYEVQALIATGGMGEVYRGARYAFATAPSPSRRCRRTCRAIQRGVSVSGAKPNRSPASTTRTSARSTTSAIEDDVHYLVMEYIEGETLEARLARGPLPLATALEYATRSPTHSTRLIERGMVHSDMKPSNVMLTKSGAKVLDFGLATRDARRCPGR